MNLFLEKIQEKTESVIKELNWDENEINQFVNSVNKVFDNRTRNGAIMVNRIIHWLYILQLIREVLSSSADGPRYLTGTFLPVHMDMNSILHLEDLESVAGMETVT